MKWYTWVITYAIVIFAICFISKWMFNAIYFSDLPGWVKYMLLK